MVVAELLFTPTASLQWEENLSGSSLITWWDYASSSSREFRNSHLWLSLGDRDTQCHCGLV